MFGWFFYPVKGFETVQEVSLQDFYNLGKEMRALTLREPRPLSQLNRLVGKQEILERLLQGTRDIPFPKTQAALTDLIDHLKAMIEEMIQRQDVNVFDHDAVEVAHEKTKRLIGAFETALDREVSMALSVFAVTAKGDKSTRILIEEPEKRFPKRLLPAMPANVISDLKEAGRCLAFDLATACAFHGCRATEALMRGYYKHLTGDDWPPPPPKPTMRKEWAVLVEQLRIEGAPDPIIQRLREIREDRNSFAHPDVTVSPDDAVVVYDLCANVMQLIAEEMK
jgi:hypothetical protein